MKPVLVDTSVWIKYFRQKDTTEGKLLREFITNEGIYTTGVVIVELITGARDLKEQHILRDLLSPVPFLRVSEPVWWEAGEYRYAMRRKGFAASLPDVVIATVAIYYDVELFSLDRHFLEIAKFIPLRLFLP